MASRTLKFIIFLALFWVQALPGFALAATTEGTRNVSRSFQASTSIVPGSIVSIESGNEENVTPTNISNGAAMIGVAIASTNSLIAIDPSDTTVQVATAGTVDVLVSNANGDIKAGDKIAASPFSSIGMKSAPGTFVIGVAEHGFDVTSDDVTVKQVVDSTNTTREIKVGKIPVALAIAYEPLEVPETNLSALQKFVHSLTGKVVSMPRIVASIVIAVATLIALGILLYASVYGSIISIGRNPLARSAIIKGLLFVLGLAGICGLIAVGTIFLLLR